MNIERTFVALKPDAVQRGLIGKIITRFEEKGFKILAMKMLDVTPEQAAAHYAEHVGKPFYDGLIQFITSAPIVAMVVEGIDAIEEIRHIVGATNPDKADVGSIRADYSPLMKCNCIHASDSVASAEREMRIYFDVEKELCTNWKTMMEVVLDGLQ
ncbi:MAG: nucleoside-diphosphate kinase [Candidatus Melainabacteria bacterium]|mgnify:FL=1|nr:MAG: nucleoside-diphosphate kinase [Candidatus Melainabacteria bacterium]RAI10117.1 MAG: nucleoside-diphosphate kinase [Candidatus Melainabacteria bacterium]